MKAYASLPDFLKEHESAIFRLWVYRRVYTPYETQNAFVDESMYETQTAILGMIQQCINLRNGDFLLGFQEIEGDGNEDPESLYNWIEYYRLSEIRLELIGYNKTMEEKKCT